METRKILLIGDIVARPGRQTVETLLPPLREELSVDLVIANAENLAGGRGVTSSTLRQMKSAGVDYFTSGDHVTRCEGWEEMLVDESLNIIRPANYPANFPGSGYCQFEIGSQPFLLINLEGSEMMKTKVRNPFVQVDEILDEYGGDEVITIVDFHAELTSEKRALGFYLDGRVNIFVGTHTHVPTADLQVLPKGTFYVSDLGMTGSIDSVLGVKKEIIIRRFIGRGAERFEWQYDGPKVFNAVLVEVESTGKIINHQRVDRIIP